jgi:ornithine cyclodeaminase/alanine dehydrogenase-like protein (mu-crystallin family)
MIFLTNEHVQQVLDMKTCIEAMEDAYRALNEQRAGYRPRIDFYVPQEPHYYRWGTMEGASRKLAVFAIRMKSDMLGGAAYNRAKAKRLGHPLPLEWFTRLNWSGGVLGKADPD